MAYEHMYMEDLQKIHNNIEDAMRGKVNLKFEAKRKKVGQKKKKNKRSATPGLSIHYN